MNHESLVKIRGLRVEVDGKEIIHGLDLEVGYGETQVIFGPNGSGKTTLLMSIMGFPRYRVTSGTITFKGHDVTTLSVDERAKLGIGIAFQRPPVIRGIKTKEMISICLGPRYNEETIESLAQKASMVDFLERDINYGFSGGELKRSETLQLLAQRPDLVLLDEPESGVDLENIALIGQLINELLEKTHPIQGRTRGGIIISHTGYILNYVHASLGNVMYDGRIICQGDPHEILDNIKHKGYQGCVSCLKQ